MSYLSDHVTKTKTYIVLSGARTGSSLLQYILWPYCRNHGYKRPLGELFITKNWLYDTGKEIGRIRLTNEQANELLIDEREIGRQQLALIQKYRHQKYLFKVTADFLKFGTETQIANLFDHYSFIIIDRHNTREMALSFTIAMNSDLYIIREQNETANLIRGRFDPNFHGPIIRDTYDSFQSAKAEIRKRTKYVHEVWYEDILKYNNPYQFLQELGFEDWKSVLRDTDKLPYKVSGLINKESYIENIDEFNAWCLANGFIENVEETDRKKLRR